MSHDQQSDRLKGLSVLLYVLGLSYGAVEDVLEAFNTPLSKTAVYLNVQEAGMAARQQQRQVVLGKGERAVIGGDGTYLKVKGQEVGVQVVVDDSDGELLGLEIIVSESTEAVVEVVRAVAEQVKAKVLVSDDLDAYKGVADKLALEQRVLRSHVKRNVDALAEELQEQVQARGRFPEGVEASPERLVEDLAFVQDLVRARPAEGEDTLGAALRPLQGGASPGGAAPYGLVSYAHVDHPLVGPLATSDPGSASRWSRWHKQQRGTLYRVVDQGALSYHAGATNTTSPFATWSPSRHTWESTPATTTWAYSTPEPNQCAENRSSSCHTSLFPNSEQSRSGRSLSKTPRALGRMQRRP